MSEKRNIFEEVGDNANAKPTAQPGAIDRANKGARRGIRLWLIVLFAMVVAMIVVGGLTRLTDSGLSITEWKPVTGALPPMDDVAWLVEFGKYQETPEYLLQNKGMSLSEFQFIYWWEWGHRQLGRTVGLVWFLGYLGFAATKNVPTGWHPRLIWVGALGGLQGAVGWWMVSSGLQGSMLDVASYRLATHLGLAFIILGYIAWYVLLLGREERDLLQARRSKEPKQFGLATGLLHLAFLQILIGALVAGIDAGRNYPDWPMMAGGFLPPDLFALEPWWRNFFEDDGLVQFMHRIVGYVLFVFAIVVWRRGRQSAHEHTQFAFNAVIAMISIQMVLGITTVLY